MKKKIVVLLVTLTLALALVVTPLQPPCCADHDWEIDSCSPPPISTYTFLLGANNG